MFRHQSFDTLKFIGISVPLISRFGMWHDMLRLTHYNLEIERKRETSTSPLLFCPACWLLA